MAGAFIMLKGNAQFLIKLSGEYFKVEDVTPEWLDKLPKGNFPAPIAVKAPIVGGQTIGHLERREGGGYDFKSEVTPLVSLIRICQHDRA